MSRHPSTVKTKLKERALKTRAKTPQPRHLKTTVAQTIGAIDLHFHGAFGIDLMSASPQDLDELSLHLWRSGIAGFCPTTLSASPRQLGQTVQSLGKWIRSGSFPGAHPLGIHLEGPWINSERRGAHPARHIRPWNPDELEQLWELSQNTIKIITLAPELLSPQQLQWLVKWTQKRQILLSAGHSGATQAQAQRAFKAGIQGVTHSWNAMSYHHREAGIMGAALGCKDIYLELIIDQVHLSREWIRWTRQLHPSDSVCLISDCVSPTGLNHSTHRSSPWFQFGDLAVQLKQGASRLKNGHLAGGGRLLTQSYCNWVKAEAKDLNCNPSEILKNSVHQLTTVPTQILGISSKTLSDRQVLWTLDHTQTLAVIPIDSSSIKR